MVCKEHTNTEWHKIAVVASRLFLQDVPLDIQINQHSKKIIENKKILSSIISCVTFSGTRDLPLRGKHHDEGSVARFVPITNRCRRSVIEKPF